MLRRRATLEGSGPPVHAGRAIRQLLEHENRERVAIARVIGTSGGYRTCRNGLSALLPWGAETVLSQVLMAACTAVREDGRVTPRERKDMPWLLIGFAIVIIIIVGSAISEWLS